MHRSNTEDTVFAQLQSAEIGLANTHRILKPARNIGSSLPGDLLMTSSASAVPVCCCSDPRSSLSNRTFSIWPDLDDPEWAGPSAQSRNRERRNGERCDGNVRSLSHFSDGTRCTGDQLSGFPSIFRNVRGGNSVAEREQCNRDATHIACLAFSISFLARDRAAA